MYPLFFFGFVPVFYWRVVTDCVLLYKILIHPKKKILLFNFYTFDQKTQNSKQILL